MDTLNIKEGNMCVNIMDVISMVVRDVFLTVEKTTMNNNTSIAQRWRDTQIKEKRLRDQGYIVLSKWSCEFAEERKKPKVRDFLNTLNIQDPINLRECYFGGRTNALVLHKKFS